MPELLVKLNDIFERRTKRNLALATLGSIASVAMLDTLRSRVIPLVDLGHGGRHSPVRSVSSATSWATLRGDGELCLAVDHHDPLGAQGPRLPWRWDLVDHRIPSDGALRRLLGFLRHFLTAPYTKVSRRSSSELLQAMDTSVMQVFNFTVNGLMYAVSNAIAIIAILVALLVVAPLPTLGVVVYFGLSAVLYMKLVKPRATAAGLAMAHASMAGWRTALAALGGIKELNIRGTQEHFVHNYEAAQLRGAHAGRVAGFLGALPKYVLEILFIVAIGLFLLLSVPASGSDSARSAVALVALFVAAGFRVLPSVTGLLANASYIRVGSEALDLVHAEVLAARDVTASAPEDGPALEFHDALRLENVSFRYPEGDRDVLDSISIEVRRGSSVAFVGSSGAGKSTLVDVMLGLHQPRSGRVTVDGVDIAGVRHRWQKIVGYVAQDVYILDSTLAENVAFDRRPEDIDQVQLVRAVDQAQLGEMVEALPEGVQTPLGERGTRLSGGQRQRVGIARALYRAPSLLFFDEATSALDNETEHRISETIASLHGEMTVVIVAHRLSTVRHVDQVVFMKDGRVEAVGTFKDVREQSKDFARLVELGSLTPPSPTPRDPLAAVRAPADL